MAMKKKKKKKVYLGLKKNNKKPIRSANAGVTRLRWCLPAWKKVMY